MSRKRASVKPIMIRKDRPSLSPGLEEDCGFIFLKYPQVRLLHKSFRIVAGFEDTAGEFAEISRVFRHRQVHKQMDD